MTSDQGPADEKDDTHVDATNPPPGPADHGRDGGMATREVAPDVVKQSSEPPD
jgi:hypothetical protein